MTHEIPSPFAIQVITALIHVLVDGRDSDGETVGKYRTGRDLQMFLGNANIELDLAGSSRNSATRDALVKANRTEPGAVERVIEQVVDPREYGDDQELNQKAVDHLNRSLYPDGLELRRIASKYKLLPSSGAAPVTEQLNDRLRLLDYDSVDSSFREALDQAETNPSNAAKEACSLVESVCKCILEEMGEPYPKKQDIQGLVKALSDKLNLSPARTDIEQDIKQILGGLLTVTNGIGALRTHEGAHGKGKKVVPIDSRIARLAIHAASTIALFYIETWQKKAASGGPGKVLA